MRKIAIALLAGTVSSAAAAAEEIKLVNLEEMIWETTPEGVAFSKLQGDRFSQPYQALVKLPAGTESPPHIKSANMYGVMLQGQMIHYSDGTDPATATTIGPGAYYSIPRGLPHISACVSKKPCITYLYQDGAFDFLPVSQ